MPDEGVFDMQYVGMTFIVALLALVWFADLFMRAPLGIKLLFLSPLLWATAKLLWAVYKRLAWEIKRRRRAARNQRVAD
jgi:hypothetical protein